MRLYAVLLQVLEASAEVLSYVARTLKIAPGLPSQRSLTVSSSRGTDGFNWIGFDEVLSRIWHGTHAVRQIVNSTRAQTA